MRNSFYINDPLEEDPVLKDCRLCEGLFKEYPEKSYSASPTSTWRVHRATTPRGLLMDGLYAAPKRQSRDLYKGCKGAGCT